MACQSNVNHHMIIMRVICSFLAIFSPKGRASLERLEAIMSRPKLRNLASRLKARLEEVLEAAAGALLPRPEPRPIPIRVRPQRQPRRD